jgi:choline-phosphate cytidylyltransferase
VLKQGKEFYKYVHLIAGVSGDEETIRLKGKLVMTEDERAASVLMCRYVDEVVMPCPWVLTLEFLERNDIDFVAHDDIPYTSAGSDDIYSVIKKAGRFKATQRTEGISTSDLIMRIIKDYDEYVWRSLQRGFTSKDLGISKFRETKIKWGHKIDDFAQKVENKLEKPIGVFQELKNKVKGVYQKWNNNSKKIIRNFIDQFDRTTDGKRVKREELESMNSSFQGDSVSQSSYSDE